MQRKSWLLVLQFVGIFEILFQVFSIFVFYYASAVTKKYLFLFRFWKISFLNIYTNTYYTRVERKINKIIIT